MIKLKRVRRAVSLVVVALCFAGAGGEAARASSAEATSSFEGSYDLGERPLYLVADGPRLFAVIGDATYRLTRSADGSFTNSAGQAVKFERSPAGQILAVSDGNGRYPWRSPNVPTRVRALLRPVAAGTAPWRYSLPLAEPDLPVGNASTHGLPTRRAEHLVRLLSNDPAWSGVRSLLVYRRGRLILENYFYGFSKGDAHDLRSASKSVVAALAGRAAQDGLLDLATPIWGELARAGGGSIPASMSRVTVEQVLNMQTGLACDDYDDSSPGGELKMMHSQDWIRFMLEVPPSHVEDGVGRYCSGAPIALGRLIELRAGSALPKYAAGALFRPLGIEPARVRWDFSPTWKGSEHVAGLFMTPRDMLRLGRLYLQDGVHDGRRLLPAGWVRDSFAASVKVGSWRRYGRYWWTFPVEDKVLGRPKSYMVHAAMGNGGQRIVVTPEHDAVIVMTGGSYNDSTTTNQVIAFLLRSFDETAAAAKRPLR